ncbi:MAG: hypothetical protein L0Y55_20885, partial [Anaerolineales bacterium]|nr:hypothetical protein [Anaerolineales bacterium]
MNFTWRLAKVTRKVSKNSCLPKSAGPASWSKKPIGMVRWYFRNTAKVTLREAVLHRIVAQTAEKWAFCASQ